MKQGQADDVGSYLSPLFHFAESSAGLREAQKLAYLMVHLTRIKSAEAKRSKQTSCASQACLVLDSAQKSLIKAPIYTRVNENIFYFSIGSVKRLAFKKLVCGPPAKVKM